MSLCMSLLGPARVSVLGRSTRSRGSKKRRHELELRGARHSAIVRGAREIHNAIIRAAKRNMMHGVWRGDA